MTSEWRVRDRVVPLDRPVVFGILNATPDSFSDGGRFATVDAAVAHAERMLEEGADAIDVGGESTRPQGAVPVDAAEEERRVVPVVRELSRRFPQAILSVDTVKSSVAAAALDAGAHAINDVAGLRLDPRIAHVVAATGAGLVVMHSRGTVSEMATFRHAEYGEDVMDAVLAELRTSVALAEAAGVPERALAVDPGIGFAKRSEHSLAVLAELPRLLALDLPVMVGASRKRFIGEITGVAAAADRVHGTVGANVAALLAGARFFRVHDVRANRQALDVAWAIVRARTAAGSAALGP